MTPGRRAANAESERAPGGVFDTVAAGDYAARLLHSLEAIPSARPTSLLSGAAAADQRVASTHVSASNAFEAATRHAVEGSLLALQTLAPSASLPGVELLYARTAEPRWRTSGSVSLSGASRLIDTLDGIIAVTLARSHDVEALPAVTEADLPGLEAQQRGGPADAWCAPEPAWQALVAWAAGRTADEAAHRLALLGVPYGLPGEHQATLPWLIRATTPSDMRPSPTRRPLVVSFGSLWAGPLCAQLLQRLGCEVVKVEDPHRPDARPNSHGPLFDWMHDGVEIRHLPLASPAVHDLVASADVVIEQSRPRALRQHGHDALTHPGVWLSITGHGRDSDRVGFGDDAAVAGGLVNGRRFVGDAIADPLTGVHAALAAWSCLRQPGGWLVDISLARTAAATAALTRPP